MFALIGRHRRRGDRPRALRVRASARLVMELCGNEQKVLFGRALVCERELLLLGEFASGVDIGSRGDIDRLLCTQANAGRSGMVFSSDEQARTHYFNLRRGLGPGALHGPLTVAYDGHEPVALASASHSDEHPGTEAM